MAPKPPMSGYMVRFNLNGEHVEIEVAPDRLLLDVLREDVRLTGTKEGCSVGICGLCTVLVDGDPMSACLLFMVLVDGREVLTIEGIAQNGSLSDLQEAFIREGGFQCGICTPGQILAATALITATPTPGRDEISDWMMGNLCRCTGYAGIIAAIEAAAGVRTE